MRRLLAVVASLLVPAGAAAAAEISFVDQFRSSFATQTGNGDTLSDDGHTFVTHLYPLDNGEFTAVELSYPGPDSPVAMSEGDGGIFGFGSDVYSSIEKLNSDFPTGAYEYAASDTPDDSASVDYQADFYPSQPFLSGTDFEDLQGTAAGVPRQLHFQGLPSDGNVDEQLVFFRIVDVKTSATVFFPGALSPSSTGISIPAGTLLPGHDYRFELIYSKRLFAESPGAQFHAVLAWESRTRGDFETAPLACGDANADGKLTAADALFTLRTSVGALTCEPCVCDVNLSGSITAGDALQILRAAVGVDIVLECPACG